MPATFAQTVTEAVADIANRGYASPAQIEEWSRRLREAAIRSMTPEHVLDDALKSAFGSAYRRLIDNEGILKQHRGIGRFTFDKVKPRLRAELDRSIYASANLIKLNRAKAVEGTMQRFAGWATSVPAGGSDIIAKNPVKSDIRKALVSLPFEERRVLIDQGHKFAAGLSAIIAKDGNAIAAIWNHHHGNTPRPTHLERDGHLFAVRGCWAHEQGLIKAGLNGYTDEIEQPGEWVFCRCSWTWVYNLRSVPSLLTDKGRQSLIAARAAMG